MKFCFKLGKTATESYSMLEQAFGEDSIKRMTVFEWFRRFKDSRCTVLDDARSGCPKNVNSMKIYAWCDYN